MGTSQKNVVSLCMEKIDGTNYYAIKEGYIITKNWKNKGVERRLRAATDKKGYLRVGLIIDGKLCSKKVHRLIAKTFISNPENKPHVNHKNGIKNDNRVDNLEWVTPKENTAHAIRMGLFSFSNSEKAKNRIPKKGELNGNALLTEKDVINIRNSYKPRINTREMLAKEYGVKSSCIKDVLSKRSWRHL